MDGGPHMDQPSWDVGKYQTTVIVNALDTLLQSIQRKSIGGGFRLEFLKEVLIEIPSLSGDEGVLLYDVKYSRNLDDQVVKIAKLCERVVKDRQMVRAHRSTIEGMAFVLQKLGSSQGLSKDAQKIASEAAKIASDCLLSRIGRAVEEACHFFKKLFFRPCS
jgi:hypothetical protein